MIIVTGGAGFIGSCLVARLNERGIDDIIIVDHVDGFDNKKTNIKNKKYRDYYEKDAFLSLIKRNEFDPNIDCIFHLGACSSTTLTDEEYYESNNYLYTQTLAEWALKHNIRFIYASSAATYGDGDIGYTDDDKTTLQCEPLNYYGNSKQKFDLWVLNNKVDDQVVGLKYFNVFGPNEYHKENMRSVVCKAYEGVKKEGKMHLFKSYRDDYKHGEQKRDFIYVKDAVEMTLFFYDNRKVNGIFNIGTGKARSWNDLANAMFAATDQKPDIKYVDMPEGLAEKYQYFTEANMKKLKDAGCTHKAMSLEDAVSDYAQYLDKKAIW